MSLKTLCAIASTVILFTKIVNSADILLINPTPSFSHFTTVYKLASKLAERGHHITCVSPYHQQSKLPNYEHIDVADNIVLIQEAKRQLLSRNEFSFIQDNFFLFDMTSMLANHTIHNKNVQKLLASNRKFDLVIIESFLTETYMGFAHRFGAPAILISAKAADTMNSYLLGNPDTISYIPHILSAFTTQMSFWERLQNFFLINIYKTILFNYHLPKQRKIFNSYITNVEFDDVLYNASLLFTNSHPSFSPAKPLGPNIIEIGGFHLTPNPLPPDLQKYLDESTQGVVLFSMGSSLNSKDLKLETRQALLNSFAKLKQNVLWKFENDLPEAPSNVRIMRWLPQEDILGHPNVKAFITHGGRLSIIEAVYYGVPIIGIPVFGDQMGNIAQAVKDGYAIGVQLKEVSEDNLSTALTEILRNPKYKENVRMRARILHDQPLKPIDKAIFWVEYVIRHRRAPHLKPAALDLNWWQREMIDVHFVVLVIFTLSLFIIYKISRKVCR